MRSQGTLPEGPRPALRSASTKARQPPCSSGSGRVLAGTLREPPLKKGGAPSRHDTWRLGYKRSFRRSSRRLPGNVLPQKRARRARHARRSRRDMNTGHFYLGEARKKRPYLRKIEGNVVSIRNCGRLASHSASTHTAAHATCSACVPAVPRFLCKAPTALRSHSISKPTQAPTTSSTAPQLLANLTEPRKSR